MAITSGEDPQKKVGLRIQKVTSGRTETIDARPTHNDAPAGEPFSFVITEPELFGVLETGQYQLVKVGQ